MWGFGENFPEEIITKLSYEGFGMSGLEKDKGARIWVYLIWEEHVQNYMHID